MSQLRQYDVHFLIKTWSLNSSIRSAGKIFLSICFTRWATLVQLEEVSQKRHQSTISDLLLKQAIPPGNHLYNTGHELVAMKPSPNAIPRNRWMCQTAFCWTLSPVPLFQLERKEKSWEQQAAVMDEHDRCAVLWTHHSETSKRKNEWSTKVICVIPCLHWAGYPCTEVGTDLFYTRQPCTSDYRQIDMGVNELGLRVSHAIQSDTTSI